MASKTFPRLIFASSDLSADMYYATRFSVPDPFLFLEQNGKRTIVLSDLEVDRGRSEAAVDEVVSLSTLESALEKKLKTKPSLEQTLVSLLRQRRIRKAVVPADFPLGLAVALSRQGVALEPQPGLFWPGREFKSEQDLKALRNAVQITEIGLARAYEVLRAAEIKPRRRLVWAGQKLTSELLRAEIECAILRAGGLAINTIVAGGDQACDPHQRGSGPLLANSLIILDVFPKDSGTGFYGDITRTVVRGRASDAQRRLWETVLTGQRMALENIRIGESGQALQDKVKEYFTEQGYPTEIKDGRWTGFFHGLGHGLGLDIHEAPRIARTEFKPGQVLTVEPGLYFPGVGGVRHEDDGVVTEKGFRVLSTSEKVLEL
ncbi:MAG: aminopeptidase P family protein [Verrucomicrobia bacterium]|nr:aminopeptidase P family protein [Verrucomicrobiota bacterium]